MQHFTTLPPKLENLSLFALTECRRDTFYANVHDLMVRWRAQLERLDIAICSGVAEPCTVEESDELKARARRALQLVHAQGRALGIEVSEHHLSKSYGEPEVFFDLCEPRSLQSPCSELTFSSQRYSRRRSEHEVDRPIGQI